MSGRKRELNHLWHIDLQVRGQIRDIHGVAHISNKQRSRFIDFRFFELRMLFARVAEGVLVIVGEFFCISGMW